MANPRRIEHARGTSWEITYRVDGRTARRRFRTKKQALHALAQARVDTASGTGVLPAQSKVTVSAYGERCMRTLQVGPSTRAGYDNALRVHIGPLLGGRPLSSLRRSDVAALVAALVDPGLAPTTGASRAARTVRVPRNTGVGVLGRPRHAAPGPPPRRAREALYVRVVGWAPCGCRRHEAVRESNDGVVDSDRP